MPSRKLFALVALVTLIAVIAASGSGTNGLYGQTGSFGNHSYLESHYVFDGSDEPIPVCHVLFVPQWDPRVDARFHFGAGGDAWDHSFRVGYEEQGVKQFDAPPLTVRRRRLLADVFEGGGDRFYLAEGNIFVVAVGRDGSLRVSQVPRLEGEPQSSEILAAVKKALPNDARVQALYPEG